MLSITIKSASKVMQAGKRVQDYSDKIVSINQRCEHNVHGEQVKKAYTDGKHNPKIHTCDL